MKTKLDFVTNSSSTSVVMWGTYLDQDEIKENKILMELLKEWAKSGDWSDQDLEDELVEAFSYVAEKAGLDNHGDYEGGGTYVGVSPFNIKDEETGKDFKAQIKDKLKSIGVEKEIERIEESWFNG